MAKSLFFEDVKVDEEIAPLIKKPTKRQVVEWIAASEEYAEVHFDKDFAQQVRGLPDVIVPGRLQAAFLVQLLADWIRPQGRIATLSLRSRAIDFPGKTLICRCKVIRKWVEKENYYVECEVWSEGEKGERTVDGSAIVNLPDQGMSK
jgi:hydroxyacyl-ACP dehydratase HTD2-like protein with hotdog domain